MNGQSIDEVRNLQVIDRSSVMRHAGILARKPLSRIVG
jgi:hypothetical protein